MHTKLKCKNCNKHCPLNYYTLDNGEKVYYHYNSNNATGERKCMTPDYDGKFTTHKQIYCGCTKPELKVK